MLMSYHSFGSEMPGPGYKGTNDYRYGFNGMERNPELDGTYTTEFRQYNANLGRWFSPDPLMSMFPHQSPYNFSLNNPINLTDKKGDCPDGNCDEVPKDVDGADDYSQNDYYLSVTDNSETKTNNPEITIRETVVSKIGNYDDNNKELWVEKTIKIVNTIVVDGKGKTISSGQEVTEYIEEFLVKERSKMIGIGMIETKPRLYKEGQTKVSTIKKGEIIETSEKMQSLISLQSEYSKKITGLKGDYPNAFLVNTITQHKNNLFQLDAYGFGSQNPAYGDDFKIGNIFMSLINYYPNIGTKNIYDYKITQYGNNPRTYTQFSNELERLNSNLDEIKQIR